MVPWPAAVVTGFIDVQGNRFEWGLWAWGEGFQGWLVDRGVIGFDYNDENGWRAIDALTARRWPTQNGREIDVLQWGIDTGAFTQVLYDRVSRRDALHATKGDNKRPRGAVQADAAGSAKRAGAHDRRSPPQCRFHWDLRSQDFRFMKGYEASSRGRTRPARIGLALFTCRTGSARTRCAN